MMQDAHFHRVEWLIVIAICRQTAGDHRDRCSPEARDRSRNLLWSDHFPDDAGCASVKRGGPYDGYDYSGGCR